MMVREIETPAEAAPLQWFAVRVRGGGGLRQATVGGTYEGYRDRAGSARKRRVTGTGQKVFLPEHLLRRAGFEVFLPVKKDWRRKNRFAPDKVLVARPLLADWLFVGWAQGINRWEALMALDVVAGVMGTGGRPVSLPERQIHELMRRWGGGQLEARLHHRVQAVQRLRRGDLARVVEGPLADQSLRVMEVNGPSVKGLIEMLGGPIPVEMPADLLAPPLSDG